MTTETADQTTNGDTSVSPETGNVVFEEPSFDDLKWPPEPVYTYAQLYEKLVRQISREEAWERMQRLLVVMMVFTTPLITITTSSRERLYQGWNGVVFLLMALLVTSIVFFAWTHNRSVADTAGAVMARLIVATRSPRTGEQGLNSKELRRLRQVAEDEQQAADWRGSIVTTLIITLVLTVIVAAVREVGPDFFEGLIDGVGSGQPMAELAIWIIIWVLMFIGFAFIAFSLFRYYRRFISGEMANRVILLATAEALTTLDDFGLIAATALSFQEKVTVIGCAGYQLSRERLSFSWTDGMPFAEFDLRPNPPADWYLEPLIPKLRATLPQTLLAFFYMAAVCVILIDNLIYGGLLILRAKNRRLAYERLGRQTTAPPRLGKRFGKRELPADATQSGKRR